MSSQSLFELKNIGKTVVSKLLQINITNKADLQKIGSAKAYQLLTQKNAGQYLPVCYYLYSLEGAIQDRDWRNFSNQEKTKLRRAAGLYK